jgi:hypothetical protein
MGYILKLPTAGSPSLPSLGDIGYISKQNLRALYLIDGGVGLTDSSGNGANLSLANGSIAPPYSAGVLQFRLANVQRLTTGVTITGAAETMIIASRKVSSATNGMVLCGHGNGVGINSANPMALQDASNASTGTLPRAYGLQSKQPTVTYGNNGVGMWRVLTMVRNAAGISLSADGQAPVTVAYNTPDPGTTTSSAVDIGDITAGVRHVDADIGFFAVYDRALTAAEITSTYKAIKRLMAAKGLVI